MANHVNRNNFDENAEDIHNDVSQLADTLEEVLKSWGSDAKEEAEAARVKAQSLLKETRARLNGHNRVRQAAITQEITEISAGAAAQRGAFGKEETV